MPLSERPATTESGRRNWNRLVSLAEAKTTDVMAAKQIADALAALMAEVTPMHREVMASKLLKGAVGRLKTWKFPPGIQAGEDAQRRWAAQILLDCVDNISDTHSKGYSLAERQGWRTHAERYTQGAER